MEAPKASDLSSCARLSALASDDSTGAPDWAPWNTSVISTPSMEPEGCGSHIDQAAAAVRLATSAT